MRIAVPNEVHPGEHRVAASPQTVMRLLELGFTVAVEAGAGAEAGYSDASYAEAGATLVEDVKALYKDAEIVLKVRAPQMHPTLGAHETDFLPEGVRLISFVWPAENDELLQRFVAKNATVLAMDCIPRITRAQKMDALSSMANVAGYRAILEAAQHFPRFLGGQITAAGRIDPAKVLVIGAGVAGLAAIAAARALGAVVRAFDTRPEVKEQVQSLGAEFLEIHIDESGAGEGGYAKEMSKEYHEAETQMLAQQAMEVDIIVTTALIPGKPAPELISAGMVESMNEGSVIVDLAAERGGNCALTEADELVEKYGKKIIGYTDFPSRMARQASQLYGANLAHLLEDMGGAENFKVDLEDEVVRGALVTHQGEITWPPPKPEPPRDSAAEPHGPSQSTRTLAVEERAQLKKKAQKKKKSSGMVWLAAAGILLMLIGMAGPEPELMRNLLVFMLACFIGWQVIWNVTPALHTPLISITNAISGIIIVGGMLQLTGTEINATTILGGIAVLIATINIAGGFLVTRRMLGMFRRQEG